MKCEALDNGKWRPARIDQLTPKGRNYPNGGAYVQWLDVDIHCSWISQGGWKPMTQIRGHGDLTGIRMAAY